MISLRCLLSSRSFATFVSVLLTSFVAAYAGGESTDDTAVEAPAPPAPMTASPKAAPPVCKIIDYQKFLYNQKKKQKEVQNPCFVKFQFEN